MIRLALFGHPVSQSLSPRIHQLFARQAQLAISYEAIDAPAGTLAAALDQFASEGGSGCNITMPLKGEARQLAHDSSTRVVLAEAANTLIHDDLGWKADSTDGPGLLLDLERLGMHPKGKRVALLGAGGAAASVTATLLSHEPQSLTVFNRSLDRATRLADRHRHLGDLTAATLESLASAGPFDLVINATALGHEGTLPPVHKGLFHPEGHCYDMNYGPASKPLEAWCRAENVAYESGLGMLVGQAAISFTLWTGYEPDITSVLGHLSDSN